MVGPSIFQAKLLAEHAGDLLEQSIERLQRKVDKDPKNGDIWFRLGEALRGTGRFAEAVEAFVKSSIQGYQKEKSNYLVDLLSYNTDSNTLSAAPSIEILDLDFTSALYIHFRNVFNDRDQRTSLVLNGVKFLEVRAMFKDQIKPILAEAYRIFGVKPAEKSQFTIQMTSHTDGEFYRTHIDFSDTYARLLSYIFYFHTEPIVFTGGELHLYDTNTTQDTCSSAHTSISLDHNSLVVFPSEYFHQVCTVRSQSTNRREGRNTINGWHADKIKQMEIFEAEKKKGKLKKKEVKQEGFEQGKPRKTGSDK